MTRDEEIHHAPVAVPQTGNHVEPNIPGRDRDSLLPGSVDAEATQSTLSTRRHLEVGLDIDHIDTVERLFEVAPADRYGHAVVGRGDGHGMAVRDYVGRYRQRHLDGCAGGRGPDLEVPLEVAAPNRPGGDLDLAVTDLPVGRGPLFPTLPGR